MDGPGNGKRYLLCGSASCSATDDSASVASEAFWQFDRLKTFDMTA